MSKLFKLKEYLSLDEAKTYLTNMLEEKVSMADIYRLALDDNLRISVTFHSMVTAAFGRIFFDNTDKTTPLIEIDQSFSLEQKLDKPYLMNKSNGHLMTHNSWLLFDTRLSYSNSLWDLSMLGSEYVDIQNLHQESIGENAGGFISAIKGVVLKNHDSYCLLKGLEQPADIDEYEKQIRMNEAKDEHFHNCLSLKEYGHQLVIRTEELTRFVQSLHDEPLKSQQEPKTLTSKEHITYQLIIASLLHKNKLNLNERGIAGKIRRATESNNTPVSEETIRNLLPQIRDTVELKQR